MTNPTAAPSPEQIREARLAFARRNSRWAELEEAALVPRGPGGKLLVRAETDEVFQPYMGALWPSGSAVAISEQAALAFYVGRDGDVHVVGPVPGGTWRERLERLNRPKPRWAAQR